MHICTRMTSVYNILQRLWYSCSFCVSVCKGDFHAAAQEL